MSKRKHKRRRPGRPRQLDARRRGDGKTTKAGADPATYEACLRRIERLGFTEAPIEEELDPKEREKRIAHQRHAVRELAKRPEAGSAVGVLRSWEIITQEEADAALQFARLYRRVYGTTSASALALSYVTPNDHPDDHEALAARQRFETSPANDNQPLVGDLVEPDSLANVRDKERVDAVLAALGPSGGARRKVVCRVVLDDEVPPWIIYRGRWSGLHVHTSLDGFRYFHLIRGLDTIVKTISHGPSTNQRSRMRASRNA